jgi:hypothetical protein
MTKTKLSVAMLLALVLGAAGPAVAASGWECEQLTSGGGGTWFCTGSEGTYFVDCSSGPCVYHRM